MFTKLAEYKSSAGFITDVMLCWLPEGAEPVQFTFRVITGEVMWSNDWARLHDVPGIVQGKCEHLSEACDGHTVWTGKTPE